MSEKDVSFFYPKLFVCRSLLKNFYLSFPAFRLSLLPLRIFFFPIRYKKTGVN